MDWVHGVVHGPQSMMFCIRLYIISAKLNDNQCETRMHFLSLLLKAKMKLKIDL